MLAAFFALAVPDRGDVKENVLGAKDGRRTGVDGPGVLARLPGKEGATEDERDNEGVARPIEAVLVRSGAVGGAGDHPKSPTITAVSEGSGSGSSSMVAVLSVFAGDIESALGSGNGGSGGACSVMLCRIDRTAVMWEEVCIKVR